MKKIITALITLCMVVALAVPAFALEYEIDGPGCEYGEDTSIEVVYTNEPDMNVDASKNAALVPPAFGSASAYTLNRVILKHRDWKHRLLHRDRFYGGDEQPQVF